VIDIRISIRVIGKASVRVRVNQNNREIFIFYRIGQQIIYGNFILYYMSVVDLRLI
jgi:hypothetical protein